ncbi:MAG: putative C-S lyase [Betaproteobacteria bacterium]|nr:putative C-S lyase [Betaproteobacteria bacterium]
MDPVRYDFDAPVDRRRTASMRWDKYAGLDVIPLWVADTDFRAPECVIEALQRRVEHGVFGYTMPPRELRDLIVARMQRLYGWTVDQPWIVFLPGVVSALYMAANRLTRPDEHILSPHPVYYHLFRAAQSAPRAWTDVPLVLRGGRWVWDEVRLASAVRPASKLLLLCNPQNPGGTVSTRAELERLAAFALGHDLIVCSDEIHCDLLLDPGKPHVPIASLSPEVSRRTVTLMSPSKSFNIAGAGVAFAIIEDAALREAFSFDLKKSVHDASLFGYEAAVAAYRDGEGWLSAQLGYLRGNRDLVEALVEKLPGVSMAHLEATFLAWIDCSGLGLPDPQAQFLAHGLALSPGADFGAPQFVRLNFGTQRALLREALLRLEAAVGAAAR